MIENNNKSQEKLWFIKSIINKIKNRKLIKKQNEIEELKLEIEKAKLKKELKGIENDRKIY